MTSKLEPVRCVCGRKPVVEPDYHRATFLVTCPSFCWSGPLKLTRRAAILAWNRVMGQVKAKLPKLPSDYNNDCASCRRERREVTTARKKR